MIRFAMLGSGSRGNATLVEAGGTRVLVDCGFQLKEAEARLAAWGVDPQTIDAILVTHEHADHLGGVGRFARRYETPVWMTYGTASAWPDPEVPQLHRFSPHERFTIGDVLVEPFPVPHDAREPSQYVLGDGRLRLGIVSDAGHVTPHMRALLDGCDALMLECNHDLHALVTGPYPAALKRRVASPLGHLSNAQAAGLVQAIDCARLQHLVLTHLSETNNTPLLARGAIVEALARDEAWLVCAGQDSGLAWRDVA